VCIRSVIPIFRMSHENSLHTDLILKISFSSKYSVFINTLATVNVGINKYLSSKKVVDRHESIQTM